MNNQFGNTGMGRGMGNAGFNTGRVGGMTGFNSGMGNTGRGGFNTGIGGNTMGNTGRGGGMGNTMGNTGFNTAMGTGRGGFNTVIGGMSGFTLGMDNTVMGGFNTVIGGNTIGNTGRGGGMAGFNSGMDTVMGNAPFNQTIKLNLQEMNTTNQQLINDIETNLPILNDNIKDGIVEYKNYLEGLKDERFEEKPNETEEDAIKRAESIYDRLDEMIIRNDESNKKASDIIELLKKMTNLFNGIVNNTNVEKEELAIRNNELIDIIIDLERRKTNKLIDQNSRRQGTYKGMLEDITREWNEHRIKTKETRRKQVIVPISKPSVNNLDNNEMKQIEEWTSMKIGNIIFDSDVDNWNQNTSVFDRKILNKSNLIFLIEDDDANKFGCYVNAIIDKHQEFTNDSRSFIFSLKSNGRLNGMFKFDIIEPQFAFFLFNQSSDGLFAIGYGDICICKENNKNNSYFQQRSFNYNGIQNALCGKNNFTPKRITVFQLNLISF